MNDEPRVVHDEEQHVFELYVGDDVAGYAEYVPGDRTMSITHVVVHPRYGGRGFGTTLAEAALEAARAGGLAVLPFCSFVRAHVRRNPSYLDLVPEAQRGRFGLAA